MTSSITYYTLECIYTKQIFNKWRKIIQFHFLQCLVCLSELIQIIDTFLIRTVICKGQNVFCALFNILLIYKSPYRQIRYRKREFRHPYGTSEAYSCCLHSTGIRLLHIPRSHSPRRSKILFATVSFYVCSKKGAIPALPCSSILTAARCAGLAVRAARRGGAHRRTGA